MSRLAEVLELPKRRRPRPAVCTCSAYPWPHPTRHCLEKRVRKSQRRAKR